MRRLALFGIVALLALPGCATNQRAEQTASLPDKIHSSAVNPTWVHVSPAAARRHAHCGNLRPKHGPDTKANLVWLTLDDRPPPHLDNADNPRKATSDFVAKFEAIAEHENVKLRFFLVGDWSKKYPEIVRRLRSEGHEVNNHTLNHTRLDAPTARTEVKRQIDQGMHGGHYFRPPYGAYDQYTVEIAKQNGEQLCTWTVDTVDWSTPATMGVKAKLKQPRDMLTRVKEQIGAHAVILMHLHGSFTLEMLPKIIKWLRGHHYQLEMLH